MILVFSIDITFILPNTLRHNVVILYYNPFYWKNEIKTGGGDCDGCCCWWWCDLNLFTQIETQIPVIIGIKGVGGSLTIFFLTLKPSLERYCTTYNVCCGAVDGRADKMTDNDNQKVSADHMVEITGASV